MIDSVPGIRICAIIAVRNAASTLRRVLQHLTDNLIEIVVIDNQSSDHSLDIVCEFFNTSVISIVSAKYDGVYRWHDLLRLKEVIASSVEHDWIIHQDGDEILESPLDESLRSFIERSDAQGVDVIDCDEFVFVPIEGDSSPSDFIEEMQFYYYHSPDGRKLHRLQRREPGKSGWANTGGHELNCEDRNVSKEKVRLRHYMGISYDDLRLQYLTRVFDGGELRRGWHVRRVATDLNFIREPTVQELKRLTVHSWSTDNPYSRHPIFNQQVPFVIPAETVSKQDPSNLVIVLYAGSKGSRELISLLLNNSSCKLHLQDELSLMSTIEPPQNAEDLLHVFPVRVYTGLIPELTRRFPNARYVHMLNDETRSLSDVDQKPSFQTSTLPHRIWEWVWGVREIRQSAEFLRFYHEVKIEDLERDPDVELARLMEFLGIAFSPLSGSQFAKSVLVKADSGGPERLTPLTPFLRDLGYDAS